MDVSAFFKKVRNAEQDADLVLPVGLNFDEETGMNLKIRSAVIAVLAAFTVAFSQPVVKIDVSAKG